MIKVGFFGNNEYKESLTKRIREIIISKNIAVKFCIENIYPEKEFMKYDLYVIEPEFSHEKYNGVLIAEEIRNKKNDADIFFCSMNYTYLPEIMNRYIKPTGYFIKGINNSRILDIVLYILNKNIHNDDNKMIITCNYHKVEINLQEVLYFTTECKKIICIMSDKKRTDFYDTMSSLEERLKDKFIRCHSGFLVNKNKIDKINSNYIKLKNCEENIPISRKYKTNLK